MGGGLEQFGFTLILSLRLEYSFDVRRAWPPQFLMRLGPWLALSPVARLGIWNWGMSFPPNTFSFFYWLMTTPVKKEGQTMVNPIRSNGESEPSFRIDVDLHDLLMNCEETLNVQPNKHGRVFPEPIYPQQQFDGDLSTAEYHRLNARRSLKGWGLPYLKSLWHRGRT